MRHRLRHRPPASLSPLASCTQGPDRNAALDEAVYHPPIKVACVGDSITLGAGLGDNTYPEQLQRMLGGNYAVRNFGVSGATLLTNGDKPYVQQDLYHQSLSFQPDVVVIMLGTNDSKPQNWCSTGKNSNPDYALLVHRYHAAAIEPAGLARLSLPQSRGTTITKSARRRSITNSR